jgi:hypothetical protein
MINGLHGGTESGLHNGLYQVVENDFSGNQSNIQIVRNGLVFYLQPQLRSSYPGSGTVWYDLSDYKYNATLINGPTFNPANSGSIVFDGTDDYCQVPYQAGNLYDAGLTGELTLEFWIRWETISRHLDGGIAFGDFFGNNTAGDYQWQFGKYASGGQPVFVFQVVNTTQYLDLTQINNAAGFTPPLLKDKIWYNFAYTFSNAQAKITGYINGKNVGGTLTGTTLTTIPIPGNASRRALSIGGRASGGPRYPLLGNLSSIRVYNRALTSAEVLQNYFASKSAFNL